MRSKLLVLVPALALALSACKKEEVQGPLAGCMPVNSYCAADSECCSFGCVLGRCSPNPLEGGVCQDHNDCLSPRLCIGGKCTTYAGGCISGAACTPGGAPCCTGSCTGWCIADLPPIAVTGADATVPYRIPITLTNNSYDPDTGSALGISFTWTWMNKPASSTANLDPNPSWPNPTFTPDVPGTYWLRLTAYGSGRPGPTDDVVYTAINTPPEIDMPPDVPVSTYLSRNQPLTTTANVSDADGGPITCRWAKKGPTAGTFTPVSGPVACGGASGAAAVGTSQYTLNEDEAGTWEIQLGVNDSVNPVVSVSRFISVQNDPPVVEAGPKRWGNYTLGPIPISGTATDVNFDVVNLTSGDAAFTWSWDVTYAPTGSLQGGTNVGNTPSVAFTPDHEGLYTLTLTVDDHHGGPHGGVAADTVQVQVEPYILPLGRVADAKYVDGSQKIVAVDTDVGNAYRLKIVDPATFEVTYVVTLAAEPTCVGLNATQTEATVGEVGGGWQRITGIQTVPAVASTIPAGQGAPSNLTDVVYASNCTYGMTGGGGVFFLDVAAPFAKSAICPNCTSGVNDPLGSRGAAGQAGTAGWYVWLFQTSTGRLGRYDVNTSNCNLSNPGTAFRTDSAVAGRDGFWLSVDEQDLFTAWTTVYDARSATLATRVTSPLPVVPNHLASTLVSSDLVCAVAQNTASYLATASRSSVGGAFSPGTNRPFPILGYNGNAVTNYGRFAFVRAGGGEYYAIVRADLGSGVYRWGLVNLGP